MIGGIDKKCVCGCEDIITRLDGGSFYITNCEKCGFSNSGISFSANSSKAIFEELVREKIEEQKKDK